MTAERPLTVLHFTNEPVRGGAEEHMLMLLRELDRNRFRPLVVAPPALLEMLRPDLPSDVEAIPLLLREAVDFAAAWPLRRLLVERRVDILHSHMFQASKFASPLAWSARVPVVIETPHVREHWRRGWLKGSYFLDRLLGRFVDAFIAVSEANGQYLKTEKRLPAEKIVVIRNGVVIERFDPRRKAPPELRRSLGIDEQAPVVVVLARLEPQKGHRVLLPAWKSVMASFPEARLVCVGDGSLRAELEALATELGIMSTIRFAGYQSNTPDWLAMADFTVLPSFYEGLPLVAIESLAAGRAVVATAVDGSTEVVIDGETGLTTPAGEPEPLAAAICRMLASPASWRTMGDAGRRLVEERFSQRRQVAETEDLYSRAWRRAAGVPDLATGAASPFGAGAAIFARKSK